MKPYTIIGIAIVIAAASINIAHSQEGNTAANTIRIGTFDSRGVALAYGRSDAFREKIVDMKQQHKQAKEAGDTQLADSLESLGVSLQDKMHRQVFGNAPIPGIMEELEDILPGIAAEAGVDMIVNIWDIPYKNDKVETIDLTEKIAEHYNPTDETRKILHRLKDTPPVPLDELKHEH